MTNLEVIDLLAEAILIEAYKAKTAWEYELHESNPRYDVDHYVKRIIDNLRQDMRA